MHIPCIFMQINFIHIALFAHARLAAWLRGRFLRPLFSLDPARPSLACRTRQWRALATPPHPHPLPSHPISRPALWSRPPPRGAAASSRLSLRLRSQWGPRSASQAFHPLASCARPPWQQSGSTLFPTSLSVAQHHLASCWRKEGTRSSGPLAAGSYKQVDVFGCYAVRPEPGKD
jgi:hypothetical protein